MTRRVEKKQMPPTKHVRFFRIWDPTGEHCCFPANLAPILWITFAHLEAYKTSVCLVALLCLCDAASERYFQSSAAGSKGIYCVRLAVCGRLFAPHIFSSHKWGPVAPTIWIGYGNNDFWNLKNVQFFVAFECVQWNVRTFPGNYCTKHQIDAQTLYNVQKMVGFPSKFVHCTRHIVHCTIR